MFKASFCVAALAKVMTEAGSEQTSPFATINPTTAATLLLASKACWCWDIDLFRASGPA